MKKSFLLEIRSRFTDQTLQGIEPYFPYKCSEIARTDQFHIVDGRCQVKIGIPENGHPGCPFSRKYRHPDAHIYVNTGILMPIFTVNMGIPL